MSLELLATAADASTRTRLLGLATVDAAHCALAIANGTATQHPAEADELVRFLLDEEAAVAALTFSAQPSDPAAEALLAASAHGLHVVVHHLLLRGASVDTSHPDGRSALHDAVSGGHLATARVLLDHAADPNLRASGGGAEAELPLGLALSLPSVLAAREMVRLLRSRGADPALCNREGQDMPTLALAVRPADTTLLEELKAPFALPALPAGWLDAFDQQLGRPYYFHARSKEARWEIPAPPITA